MWSLIAFSIGGLLLAGFALWLLLVISMRTKFAPFLNAIRRINRVLWNPRAMKVAGRPGAYASVIRHVGRVTGTPFETPVGVIRSEDGFIIALPYGRSPDWLKNVRASGSGVIINEGSSFRVDDPELVSAAPVSRYFSTKDRLVHRLYGVDQFLVLRRVGSDLAEPVTDHF